MLIEVNCETDFVARGAVFKELANDMAMQVAACSEVTVVDTADVPPEVVEKERSIQMEKEDILTKPEAIRSGHLLSFLLLLFLSSQVEEMAFSLLFCFSCKILRTLSSEWFTAAT